MTPIRNDGIVALQHKKRVSNLERFLANLCFEFGFDELRVTFRREWTSLGLQWVLEDFDIFPAQYTEDSMHRLIGKSVQFSHNWKGKHEAGRRRKVRVEPHEDIGMSWCFPEEWKSCKLLYSEKSSSTSCGNATGSN